jgi:asparagine synthase (glutamine-hydrolysing)
VWTAFAIALWDDVERRLFLIRDRLGKKPVYYGLVGGDLVFASELKAFWKYPGFSGDIDRRALTKYLRHNYVPSPYSIYVGVQKLPPATKVEIRMGHSGLVVGQPVPYWSVADAFAQPMESLEPAILVERLEGLLRSAVSLRMIADVPLGAFLSGGIDSSLVVALMHRISRSCLRRGALRAGGREAPRDGSHGNLPDRRRRVGRRSAPAPYVRRAVFGFVADTRAPDCARRAPAGYRRPVG